MASETIASGPMLFEFTKKWLLMRWPTIYSHLLAIKWNSSGNAVKDTINWPRIAFHRTISDESISHGLKCNPTYIVEIVFTLKSSEERTLSFDRTQSSFHRFCWNLITFYYFINAICLTLSLFLNGKNSAEYCTQIYIHTADTFE